MTTSTLQFAFTVNGVEKEQTFSTRQNVKKRVESILYLQDPPDDAVKISYVGSKELSSVNNLHIADRSDSLYANSKDIKDIEVIGSGSKIKVLSSSFLITQHFCEGDSSNIPLYFKHILDKDILSESVVVLDKNYNLADISKYRLLPHFVYTDDGTITNKVLEYRLYNSFSTGFDPATGEYEVYFVQYVLNNKTYTEILNGETAYKEASAEDIWYLTGELKPWEDVYLFDLEALEATLPAATNYAIRYLGSKRIQVVEPSDVATEDPWFPRIVNGSFDTTYYGVGYKYQIKEFANQLFQPIEPYKLAIRKLCTKLTDTLISLPNKEIQLGDFFSSIDIVIQEKDETLLYAITSDSSKDGTFYVDLEGNYRYDSAGNKISWSSERFLGIDRIAGIVHLNASFTDSNIILATYSYKEANYTLTNLSLNPIFGSDSSSFIHSVYLIPMSIVNGNLGTQTASAYWVKASQGGLVVETSQDGSGGNENINIDVVLSDEDGYSLSGVLGLHYSRRATTLLTEDTILEANAEFGVVSTDGFPRSGWIRIKDSFDKYRYMKYREISDDTITLSSDSSEIPVGSIAISEDSEIQLVNFIDELTTLSNRDGDLELSSYGEVGWPSPFKRYFVLAELSINPPHQINESSIIDVRENGGGLKEELYVDAKKLNPKAQWLNNFNSIEGQKTPGNAVIVVKLPITILEQYSLENLKEIIGNSIPFGTYPVIRFIGYEPQILELIPSETSIEVIWRKEGSEFLYDIWYAANINGPWAKANPSEISDGVGENNTYTVSGLVSEKIYYIKVSMRLTTETTVFDSKTFSVKTETPL